MLILVPKDYMKKRVGTLWEIAMYSSGCLDFHAKKWRNKTIENV